MRSITISFQNEQDAIIVRDPDDCVVVVANPKGVLGAEARIYGTRIFVPRLPAAEIGEKDRYVKEAIEVAIGVLGMKDSLYQINFQWPNGDWGVLIDPGEHETDVQT
jgi:hypothetical protein